MGRGRGKDDLCIRTDIAARWTIFDHGYVLRV
jgi:hypothetical protein